MTDQNEFFQRLADFLRNARIPFMVSGSIASSIHGEPRATNDLDIVIDPSVDALDQFIDTIPADWYVSREAARSALNSRSMFNILDVAGGWKADLIVRKDRPFSLNEFSRRTPANVLGIDVPLVTPEDSIPSKLEWSHESASRSQYADALGVAVINAKTLDRNYLRQWAAQLNVQELLTRLLLELDRRTS